MYCTVSPISNLSKTISDGVALNTIAENSAFCAITVLDDVRDGVDKADDGRTAAAKLPERRFVLTRSVTMDVERSAVLCRFVFISVRPLDNELSEGRRLVTSRPSECIRLVLCLVDCGALDTRVRVSQTASFRVPSNAWGCMRWVVADRSAELSVSSTYRGFDRPTGNAWCTDGGGKNSLGVISPAACSMSQSTTSEIPCHPLGGLGLFVSIASCTDGAATAADVAHKKLFNPAKSLRILFRSAFT